VPLAAMPPQSPLAIELHYKKIIEKRKINENLKAKTNHRRRQ
jgi:hypothetical protein